MGEDEKDTLVEAEFDPFAEETDNKDGKDPKSPSRASPLTDAIPNLRTPVNSDTDKLAESPTVRDLVGSEYNPFTFMTSSEESGDDDNNFTQSRAKISRRKKNGRTNLDAQNSITKSKNANLATKRNTEARPMQAEKGRNKDKDGQGRRTRNTHKISEATRDGLPGTKPVPPNSRIRKRQTARKSTGCPKPTNLATKGNTQASPLLHAKKGSDNDKDGQERRNGNTQISFEATQDGLPGTKSVSPKTRIRKRQTARKSTGNLKDPPTYSQLTIVPTMTGRASNSSMQKKAGGSVGGGCGADNTDDGVARMPLHSTTAAAQADFTGGIFSQKRTRLLDQWLKEHTENCLTDAVRKTIALKVPTSEKELKEDNVLNKGARRKYGPGIVRVINWFLQNHDIEIGYVKNKRKERLNEQSNRRQPKATVNKSSPVIVMVDDDSDDAKESANGAINENTTTTVPTPTSSKAATKITPSTTPNPTQQEEYNPFGVDGSKDNEPDKKPKAKITKTSLKRTREQQNVAPKPVAPSPATPLEEESYNPFGDNLDSDNESDEQPKVQVPTKSTKRTREQRNSDTRATKTPPHSNSFKQQPKRTATKASKRISRKGTSAVSKQVRTSNGTKHTSAVAPRNLQYSRLGICDSSDDDDRAVPLQSLTNQAHSPSILSAEQTEALDQWILRKAKIRAELEHLEMGNNKIEHWNIISSKARKVAAVLVPTSEDDLLDQQIFSDSQRRLYGKFLIWIVREFLEAEKITVAEIRNRRKDKAAREIWQSEKYDSSQIGNSDESDITVEEKQKIAKKRKRENDRLRMSGRKQKIQANSEACQVDGSDLDLQLLEQGYCAEWLDKDGQKLCVYGTVTEFVPTHADDDDEDKEMKRKYVSIEYAEDSRSLLNMHHTTVKNLCILGIEPMHIARAWGGCLLYQEKQNQIHAIDPNYSKSSSSAPFPIYPSIKDRGVIQTPMPLRWRVPDLYTRATNFQESAPNMPSLCLHYSAFKLEFTVQPSTILNSGNGVFLSLTSLLNPPPVFSRGRNECATNQRAHHPYDQQRNVPVFSLPPGEVLDIGVYAPLTSQDETPDHIMLVRSFLQSFWCDSYSMNTRDKETVFDITHGRGELTNEAKRSILPFVNENNQWQTHRAEVQLIEDPQGSFHYVLGYRYDELLGEDMNVLPFRQLADGRPREIFVDYGAQYEMVRLRHGYPRIPIANEAERKEILDEDEREKLDIMFEFSAKKLQEAIQCVYEFVTTATMIELQQRLQELHDDDENDRNNLRERVLAATVVLQARSEQLRPEVVHQSRSKNNGQQTTEKQSPRESLRRNGSYYEVEPTNGHDYVDFEGMSLEDWNAVDTQLQAIVEKLLPGKSLSSLLSSILKDKRTINDSSLLGMACTIVVTEVKKNSDDLLEGDYVEF